MTQTRWMSLVESMANVVVGYVVAVATQMLVFPLFGMQPTFSQNLWIGLIFTIVSLVRSYLLRRGFEILRARHAFPSSKLMPQKAASIPPNRCFSA